MKSLGYGICFYRQFNWYLFLIFVLFSFLSLVPLRIYQYGTGYTD